MVQWYHYPYFEACFSFVASKVFRSRGRRYRKHGDSKRYGTMNPSEHNQTVDQAESHIRKAYSDSDANEAGATKEIHKELLSLWTSDGNNLQFQADVAKIRTDLNIRKGSEQWAQLALPPLSIAYPQSFVNGSSAGQPPMDATMPAALVSNPNNGPVNNGDTTGIDRRFLDVAQPLGSSSCGPTSLTEAFFDFQAPDKEGINFDRATFVNPASREAARAAVEKLTLQDVSHGNIHQISQWAATFFGDVKDPTTGKEDVTLGKNGVIDHFGDTNLSDLTEALQKGHGAIVNVAHHYVYVPGMTANGQYVVGDPAHPETGTWSPEYMNYQLKQLGGSGGQETSFGFAEVWNPNKPVHTPGKVVSTDSPNGQRATNVINAGNSGSGGGSGGGGGGGSGGGGSGGGGFGGGGSGGGGFGGGGSGGFGGGSEGGNYGGGGGGTPESSSVRDVSNVSGGGGTFSGGGGGGGSADTSDLAEDPNAATDDPDGYAAMMEAEQEFGVPYQMGGAGPATFDCSGLTMFAWAKHGVDLPHEAQAQFDDTAHVQHVSIQGADGKPDFSKLKPGDLLFYGSDHNIGHVTMFAGMSKEGKPLMIEAPDVGQTVHLTPVRTEGLNMQAGRPHK
jgi:cell wall-associated NlpC family hydrolase